MSRVALLCLCVALCGAAVLAGPGVPEKVFKKIAMHHLMAACWGKQNMLSFYEEFKKASDKCMKLTPTFDLDIDFTGQQQMPAYNAPTRGLFGPQQPAQQAFSGFNSYGAPATPSGFAPAANPYDQWMAFLAFQQAQAAAAGGSRAQRRYRRGAKTEAEVAEFVQDLMDFKMETKENIGNLTCVLADIGVLDANLQINLRFYTHDMWTFMSKTEDFDPEFRSRITEKYEDCDAIAKSIPQSVLDKHPMAKKFGRHMIFFKCAWKMEMGMCAKQELVRWMEMMHEEKVTPAKLISLGLPGNKFEAAMIAMKVKHRNTSGPQKFVSNFLFTGGVGE